VLSQNNSQFSEADLQALTAPNRTSLQAQVNKQFKTNRYDLQTGDLVLTAAQTKGLQQAFKDYRQPLAHGSRIHSIPDGWFQNDRQIHDATTFFTWTS
jgi:nitric oxide reductase subunit B